MMPTQFRRVGRRVRNVATALSAAAFALTLATVVSAQTPQRIDASQPSCKGCALVLTKVATLGSVDDDLLPSISAFSAGLAMDSKGRFFANDMVQHSVLMYDRTGKFLRSIGRKGGGPGEFDQALKVAVGVGDSLFVLGMDRISVFGPDQKFVRSVKKDFRTIGEIVVLTNSDVVMDAGLQPSGFPVAVLGAGGTKHNVGAQNPELLKPCVVCGPMLLGESSHKNQFWSTPPNVYELQEWNAAGGQMRKLLIVNSSWHRAWARTNIVDQTRPPMSAVQAVAEDPRGQLWVSGRMSIPNWTPVPVAATAPRDRGGEGKPGGKLLTADRLKRLITVIDVVDLQSGRLLLSQRFTGRQLKLFAPGYVFEAREDKDLIPVLDIFRIDIKRP